MVVIRLEDDTNCIMDYVDIRDGTDELSPRMELKCGSVDSYTFSSYNGLYIKFQTDEQTVDSGFALEILAV